MLAGSGGRRERDDAPLPVCDFCGALRARGERRRLIWDSGLGGGLVLADLCGRCMSEAARLLELYGGHGRDAIRLTQAAPVSAAEKTPLQRVGGILVRSILYVLIAI